MRVSEHEQPTIGVFDSGLGGLSVLGALAKECPSANLVYAADTAYVPYGNKSPEVIRSRVLTMGRSLINEGCSTLVVACNTATAEAIEMLRGFYPNTPIVGVEPGIKPAALQSKTGKIAVLSTVATAKSQRLAQLINRHASHMQVHVLACHGWATEVEALNLGADCIIEEAKNLLLPLIDQGVDQVVLGCTHYDFLVPLLAKIIGNKAQLVGVASAIARQACKVSNPPHTETHLGNIRLLATAFPERLKVALPALGLQGLCERITEPPQYLV